MKNVVIYFSGTGNNLFVARKLADGLGDTKIYPFQAFSEYQNELKNYDRIIFCVPSYHSHIPNYVKKMIGMMNFTSKQKIYSVVACGGNRGRAIEDLREEVIKSGGQVFGEYMIMLPGSYILGYSGFPKVLVAIEVLLSKIKISRIVKEIKYDKRRMMKRPGMFYKVADESRLQEAISEYASIGVAYTVSDECVGCGICESVCPVKNISMKDGKPTFGQDCQQCMACIQWCPKRAIDYEGKVSNRRRYHHPEVRVRDIIDY